MSKPSKITKIEFDKPVVLYEGDSLHVDFCYMPEGMTCDMILETADGTKTVIGEDVEDVIEDDTQNQP